MLTSVNSIYYALACFLGIHNSEWQKMPALWEFTDQKGRGISKHNKSSMSDQYQGKDKGKQNTVDTQVQRVREIFLEDKQMLARKKKRRRYSRQWE